MRLRIGLSLPLFRNGLVYAKTLNNREAESAELALSILATLGFVDGMRLGSATVVARVDER